MNQNTYDKIIQFSNELIYDNLKLNNSEDFIKNTLLSLDNFFDLNYTFMASLSNTGIKEIPTNFVAHNVDYLLIQEFLNTVFTNQLLLDLTEDIYILSHEDNYKQKELYKNVLKPYGFKDIAIQFIKDQKSSQYLSCVVYLEKNIFKNEFQSILEAIQFTIANAHLQNISTNRLYSHVNKLNAMISHYPVGIMYISTNHQVIHTNETAKKYLIDFGVTNSNLYNIFFTNQLYSYYMRTLRHERNSLPLRINDYLFSVVPASYLSDTPCPAYQIFDEVLGHIPNNDYSLDDFSNTAACIFIIHSEIKKVQFPFSSLKELGLTPREIDITELVAKGKNNAEIAEEINISENTVKTHLSNIYKKLNINYRTELINYILSSQK